MALKRLTPTLIVDDDLRRTLAFYRDILGFEQVATAPEEGSPTWALMKSGTVELMFEHRASFLEEAPWQPILKDVPLGGSFVLYFEVDGIDDLYDRIKSRVDLVWELADHEYGRREFTMRDCNGYVLAFGQPI